MQFSCSFCGYQNTHYSYEITQERHDYQCPFCKKSFFIRRSPPLQVLCPHSKSSLYISADGLVTVLATGKMPSKESDAAGGLVTGALVGALLGPAGAILGGLLGGALGYQGLSREAIYQDGL